MPDISHRNRQLQALGLEVSLQLGLEEMTGPGFQGLDWGSAGLLDQGPEVFCVVLLGLWKPHCTGDFGKS